jgi:hypothetical protein
VLLLLCFVNQTIEILFNNQTDFVIISQLQCRFSFMKFLEAITVLLFVANSYLNLAPAVQFFLAFLLNFYSFYHFFLFYPLFKHSINYQYSVFIFGTCIIKLGLLFKYVYQNDSNDSNLVI